MIYIIQKISLKTFLHAFSRSIIEFYFSKNINCFSQHMMKSLRLEKDKIMEEKDNQRCKKSF